MTIGRPILNLQKRAILQFKATCLPSAVTKAGELKRGKILIRANIFKAHSPAPPPAQPEGEGGWGRHNLVLHFDAIICSTWERLGKASKKGPFCSLLLQRGPDPPPLVVPWESEIFLVNIFGQYGQYSQYFWSIFFIKKLCCLFPFRQPLPPPPL